MTYPGPAIAWSKGTKTSRRRVGSPTVTVANAGWSVLVSTYTASSGPILRPSASTTS
ncbi:MAG TPA: hypothetical protein VHO07_04770 [Streptosporangiaceae bacterium]|nr:hypothetical protein [Streptosporangiaceae bacterium]